jgi:hypothetical protein
MNSFSELIRIFFIYESPQIYFSTLLNPNNQLESLVEVKVLVPLVYQVNPLLAH